MSTFVLQRLFSNNNPPSFDNWVKGKGYSKDRNTGKLLNYDKVRNDYDNFLKDWYKNQNKGRNNNSWRKKPETPKDKETRKLYGEAKEWLKKTKPNAEMVATLGGAGLLAGGALYGGYKWKQNQREKRSNERVRARFNRED